MIAAATEAQRILNPGGLHRLALDQNHAHGDDDRDCPEDVPIFQPDRLAHRPFEFARQAVVAHGRGTLSAMARLALSTVMIQRFSPLRIADLSSIGSSPEPVACSAGPKAMSAFQELSLRKRPSARSRRPSSRYWSSASPDPFCQTRACAMFQKKADQGLRPLVLRQTGFDRPDREGLRLRDTLRCAGRIAWQGVTGRKRA